MLKKMIIIGGILCNSLIFAFNISICKVEEHEAINSVVSGIKDELTNEDINYDVETCQSDALLGYQIATKFVNSNTDLIVAIGTTPSLCVFKFARQNKARLVFSSVTNPEDISVNLTNTNVTGVSNFVDLKPQLELFKKLQPNLKKLGIIYNSGESNSISIIKKLDKLCMDMGITLVRQSIQRSGDIPQAVSKLKREVDAVFITNDNTALSGISLIVRECDKNCIPVYVSDTDQVIRGCLASLGPNQYELGRQTGRIIRKIKNGKNINEIKIEYPEKTELFINETQAKKLGIQIPEEIKKQAQKIF